MPELSILIVSYNTRNDLDRCLHSLAENRPVTSNEVVVIDNASHDGTVEAVRERWPDVRVIPLDANIGFSGANNVGFRATRSDLVMLLNSDTTVPAGTVDRLVAEMRQLPGAAVVGPRIVDGTGNAELSFGKMMSPLAELRQKFLSRPANRQAVERMTSKLQQADWVSGACLLVRRKDAEAVGFLDERYFMYCEDVDFCAAIRQRGGRVYFTPATEITHLRGRSAAVAPLDVNQAYQRAHLAFYEKHYPLWAPCLRLYLALRGKLPPKTADKHG